MTNSIDLIPEDYRTGVIRRKRLRTYGWVVAVFCSFIVIASLLLAKQSAKLKLDTQRLRTGLALNTLHQEQLATLDDRLSVLNQEWVVLQSLRSGAAAEDLFVVIDNALPGTDVWFDRWMFRRAGVVTSNGSTNVNAGYLILASDDSNARDADWEVETHMNIAGQAKDHAALSRFVRGLYDQPQIQEVKLNQTRIREYSNRTVVDFELAVVLLSEPAV